MTTCTKRQWIIFNIIVVIILLGGGITALWYSWTGDCGYVDRNCSCQDSICQVCTLSQQLNATNIRNCDRCHNCKHAEHGCTRWIDTPILIGGIFASIIGLMMLGVNGCTGCRVPRRYRVRSPGYDDYGALDG